MTEIDGVELVEVVPFLVVKRVVPFLSDESGWASSCVSLIWPVVRRTGGIEFDSLHSPICAAGEEKRRHQCKFGYYLIA